MSQVRASIPELETKVYFAIGEYLNQVGRDHHKHRDGHFEISRVWEGWSCNDPTWVVHHPGYIREIDRKEFHTYRDALEYLLAQLKVWEKDLKEWYDSES